jgi:phosphoglycolate phosphatase
MHSSLYPGTATALGALREAGVALGICTNKPDAIARELLQALGLTHAFGFVQGWEEGMAKKPDPAGMRRVLQELGAAPSASFMVGDSVTDVETACAAGLAGVILVSYGYTAIPARALGADAVIDRLDELPGALARLATTKS